MSKIEWTGKTWNPVTGCTEISSGCRNCYARTMHRRLSVMGQAKYSEPFHTVRFHPDALDAPLRRKKPTTYFVNSMSDLFHDEVANEQIAAVFGVMAACPQHTFQVLTKRPEQMNAWFMWLEGGGGRDGAADVAITAALGVPELNAYVTRNDDDFDDDGAWDHLIEDPPDWPLPNVWLGVSCEDQQRADERIPLLLNTPALTRFVSIEPMLGPVDISQYMGDGWGYNEEPFDGPLDLVIVGGESGSGARHCNVTWIRSIVEQCKAAGVAVFVKQDSGAKPGRQGRLSADLWSYKQMPKPTQ